MAAGYIHTVIDVGDACSFEDVLQTVHRDALLVPYVRAAVTVDGGAIAAQPRVVTDHHCRVSVPSPDGPIHADAIRPVGGQLRILLFDELCQYSAPP